MVSNFVVLLMSSSLSKDSSGHAKWKRGKEVAALIQSLPNSWRQ
jgi:molybdopterin-binding protein